MSVKKLSKESLLNWVDEIISTKKKVYGVQKHKDKTDRFEFAPLDSTADLRLDYDVTVLPPKKYFQPPTETLVAFDLKGGYKAACDTEKFIVIGIHPYDMIAINQMDELFQKDNYDSHYMTRRNNATIIACDVATASKDIFASSMKTATVKKGYDILLTDIGNGYVAEAATKKGQLLLDKAKTEKASDADIKARQAVWENNEKNLNKHPLNCQPSEVSELLEKAYNHPVWEEKAKTCFSCGSCNQVCPTCYCFNVHDDMNWDLKSGDRKRTWDGCLLDGFTKVAPDHEFRAKKSDRFRHRLYRKGKYVPSKIGGQIACVGCGRCIGACLPDIANPVKVYNRLLEDTSAVKK
ncbi:MAG: 4Fe-4S dicluster domain-containing protein [Phycisphaerae bacterium]|nr:4Fe-4S dicluster domain-containing protein [Phycisphaerae bacterium]